VPPVKSIPKPGYGFRNDCWDQNLKISKTDMIRPEGGMRLGFAALRVLSRPAR